MFKDAHSECFNVNNSHDTAETIKLKHHIIQDAFKESKILKIQNLTIEIDNRSVFKNGLRIKLTDIEYSILKLLIDHSDREISRIMILENVWGYKPDRDVDTRIVDVNISRLRLKIEETPHEPTLIRTVRGFGYIFNRC